MLLLAFTPMLACRGEVTAAVSAPSDAMPSWRVTIVRDAAVEARVGALAWVWKDDASDRAALSPR